MRRLAARIAVAIAVVALFGCGGGEEEPAQTTDIQDHDHGELAEGDRPGYVPPPTVGGGITPGARDTLRVHAKRHKIVRDEYWETKGGVLANDYFEVWYPRGRTSVTHGMFVFDALMPARFKLKNYLGEAPEEPLVIVISSYMETYKKMTGRDWWYYSEIKADTMTFQPVSVLVQRKIDHMAVPHEYYQWAIRKLSRNGAPRWLEEGFASYFSEEGGLLENQLTEFPDYARDMTADEIEVILDAEEKRSDSRIAYYRSYRMVQNLIDTYGDDKLKEVVRQLGLGTTFAAACEQAFGVSNGEVMRVATNYEITRGL